MENTTIIEPADQVLIDINHNTMKVVDWAGKKRLTDKLANACQRLSGTYPEFQKRAKQLFECGEYLEFLESGNTGEKRLHRAFFCKYRLCQMCNWRKSLKHFGQLSQVMDAATSQGYKFLFATMSVRNCSGEDLSDQITDLNRGYSNLVIKTKRKDIKKHILGTMRTIEVTRNLDPNDEWYGSFNAHIHALFAVKKRYFKDGYIKQSDWLRYWKSGMGVDYEPHFHIKAVKKGREGGSIREVAKYATKATDILTDDPVMTDEAIRYLDRALYNRRLIAYTGVLKKIKSELNLDDVESGDLINVDGDQVVNPELEWTVQRYRWNSGYGQYMKI